MTDLKQERLRLRLCVQCGAKLKKTDGRLCAPHQKVSTEHIRVYNRALRAERRRKRLCVKCGVKLQPWDGNRMCQAHRARSQAENRLARERRRNEQA